MSLTHTPQRTGAFTLIELLIVVGIIAILAAIAVPNFLEAQTRSRVARTHADMRSQATAFEAYQVDNNAYPALSPMELDSLVSLVVLTTPIAYLSQLPADPFVPEMPNRFPTFNGLPMDWSIYYRIGGTITRPFVFGYEVNNSARDWSPSITSHPSTAKWMISSAGPDGVPEAIAFGVAAYDPTNGTVSIGNIYWSGPGIGLDGPSGVQQLPGPPPF